MDSYGIHNVKIEKANAILRYRRLQRITTLLRFVEFFFFFVLVSRFSTQLPFAFKLSGEYFRGLTVAMLSPRCVFVVGNLIIIVLFLKSGQLSAKHGGKGDSAIDFYDEYMKNCEKNRNYTEEDKKKPGINNCKSEDDYNSYTTTTTTTTFKESKVCRSHSMSLQKEGNCEDQEHRRQQLMRSMTETCWRSYTSDDEMSNEEFRRKVEAFIARQQRFLREEEFSANVSVKA